MKNNVMLGIAVTLSLFSFSSDAIASEQPTEAVPAQIEAPLPPAPSVAPPGAQSTALIVTFPNEENFTITQQQQPTTLLLAQPIVSATGEVIAPINSPVQATLVATDEGAIIQVEGVVILGQLFPIRAVSSELPSIERILSTDGQNAGKSARFWGKTGMAVGCMFGGCSIDSQRTGGSAGAVLGALTSRQRGADIEKVVQIEQGSVYILPVQAP